MILDRQFAAEAAHKSYEEDLEAWRTGSLSSSAFFHIALGEFYKQNLYGLNRETAVGLDQVPQAQLIESLNNSPIIWQAHQAGLDGTNPPPEILGKLSAITGFDKVLVETGFKEKGYLVPLNIDKYWEIKGLDPALASLLIFRLHIKYMQGHRMYDPKNPDLFKNYRDAVYKALPASSKKDGSQILYWLHREGLTSDLNKMKVLSLESINSQARSETHSQRLYFPHELPVRLAPVAYLAGLEDRFHDGLHRSRNSLPDFIKNVDKAREIIRGAFFIRNSKHRLTILTKVIKSIHDTGSVNGAKEILAEEYAANIQTGLPPIMPNWQREELGLDHLISDALMRGIDKESKQLEQEQKKPPTLEIEPDQPTPDGTASDTESDIQPQTTGITTETPPPSDTPASPHVEKQGRDEAVDPGTWKSVELFNFLSTGIKLNQSPLRLDALPERIMPSEILSEVFDTLRTKISEHQKLSMVISRKGRRSIFVKYHPEFSFRSWVLDEPATINKLSLKKEAIFRKINNIQNILGEIIQLPPFLESFRFLFVSITEIPHPNSFSPEEIYDFLTSKHLVRGAVSEEFNFLFLKTADTINPHIAEGVSRSNFASTWNNRFKLDAIYLPDRHLAEQKMNAHLEQQYNFRIYYGLPENSLVLLNN